jgi:hypothetical protein
MIIKYMKYFRLFFMAVCASFITVACADSGERSVTLVGYNYTDRPIFTFSVNGAGGGNIFINGGGASFVCCADIVVGKEALVKWEYSYTKSQYMKGVRSEYFSSAVITPRPESASSEYLEVHFYPDNHVELNYVDFPGKRRLPKIQVAE